MGMKDVLQSLAERLHYSANVRTAFGEPVESHGRTIIPVAKIAYGLGGGAGWKANPARGETETSAGDSTDPETGGGGIIVTPVGFVEILSNETRFVAFDGGGKKLLGSLLAGVAIGLLLRRGKKTERGGKALALHGNELRT